MKINYTICALLFPCFMYAMDNADKNNNKFAIKIAPEPTTVMKLRHKFILPLNVSLGFMVDGNMTSYDYECIKTIVNTKPNERIKKNIAINQIRENLRSSNVDIQQQSRHSLTRLKTECDAAIEIMQKVMHPANSTIVSTEFHSEKMKLVIPTSVDDALKKMKSKKGMLAAESLGQLQSIKEFLIDLDCNKNLK